MSFHSMLPSGLVRKHPNGEKHSTSFSKLLGGSLLTFGFTAIIGYSDMVVLERVYQLFCLYF